MRGSGGGGVMSYSFATNDAGTRRMRAIAAFFDPTSAAFVREHMAGPVKTAVDLGCGPGETTRMLAEATDAGQVFGLDNAEDALTAARAAHANCQFLKCDLVNGAWPVRADVAFCRFLLSHLSAPNGCLSHWVSQLNPGGALLIDELQHIEPGHAALGEYLDVARAMVALHGATLEVGPTLRTPAGCRVLTDRVDRFVVPNELAAFWFSHNVRSLWPTSEFVCSRVTERGRLRLLEALEKMIGGESLWFMRRLALQ